MNCIRELREVEQIIEFRNTTGADEHDARTCLERCDWNMQEGVGYYGSAEFVAGLHPTEEELLPRKGPPLRILAPCVPRDTSLYQLKQRVPTQKSTVQQRLEFEDSHPEFSRSSLATGQVTTLGRREEDRPTVQGTPPQLSSSSPSYLLGDSGSASCQSVPEAKPLSLIDCLRRSSKTVKVTRWKGGEITVNDGPPFDPSVDPAAKSFMTALNRGSFSREMRIAFGENIDSLEIRLVDKRNLFYRGKPLTQAEMRQSSPAAFSKPLSNPTPASRSMPSSVFTSGETLNAIASATPVVPTATPAASRITSPSTEEHTPDSRGLADSRGLVSFPVGAPLTVMVRLYSGHCVKVVATNTTTVAQLEAYVRPDAQLGHSLATLRPTLVLPMRKTLGELNLANTLLIQQAPLYDREINE